MTYPKPVDALSYEELSREQVWQFVEEITSPEMDETWVSPVIRLPVDDLSGRVVTTHVTLANGATVVASLGNVECNDAFRTSVFLAAFFHKPGEMFHFNRYHETDDDDEGPKALAKFLGYAVEEIFPVAYDISHMAVGDPHVLKGTILLHPEHRLSDDEYSALLYGN